MDNETRYIGSQGSGQGSDPYRDPSKPKQYIPDPAEQQYNQSQYNQSQYDPFYGGPEGGPQDQDSAYTQYSGDTSAKKSSAGAIALGVLLAVLAVASIVLFFLWRSAAEEANKPPVTVTQTTTATVTQTTTKRPIIDLGNEPGPNANEPLPLPTALPTALPTEQFNLDVPPELRDALDDLLSGAESLFQEPSR